MYLSAEPRLMIRRIYYAIFSRLNFYEKSNGLWHTSRMHLKGVGFGLPLVKRLGTPKRRQNGPLTMF